MAIQIMKMTETNLEAAMEQYPFGDWLRDDWNTILNDGSSYVVTEPENPIGDCFFINQNSLETNFILLEALKDNQFTKVIRIEK